MIYGDGRQTRDFTYVADVVDGVLRCCDAPNVAGEVINVAAGGRVSLLELDPRAAGDYRQEHASRSSVRRARATSRIRRPTSSRPASCSASSRSVPFDEGLRRTVTWFQSSTPGVISQGR